MPCLGAAGLYRSFLDLTRESFNSTPGIERDSAKSPIRIRKILTIRKKGAVERSTLPITEDVPDRASGDREPSSHFRDMGRRHAKSVHKRTCGDRSGAAGRRERRSRTDGDPGSAPDSGSRGRPGGWG